MIYRYLHGIYANHDDYVSNPGTEEIPDYVIDYPKSGGVRLKQNGSKPLYKLIQANKVNCDLNAVLEQCVHENQLAVCSPDTVESAIADFTGLSSMAEWYSGMKNLESIWYQMPLEVREKFNSSKTNFVNSIAGDDFNDKLIQGYAAYNDAYAHRNDVKVPVVPNSRNVDNSISEPIDVPVVKEVIE